MLKDKVRNILLFPLALFVLVAGLESSILFSGIIFGPLTIDDLTKAVSSPVFHGLSALVVLLMFVPWKTMSRKAETGLREGATASLHDTDPRFIESGENTS